MNTSTQRVRWARKLAYAARDDGESLAATYIALLELSCRRDKPPIAYVLYRRVMPYGKHDSWLYATQILYLLAGGTGTEMVRRYFLPRSDEDNDFPGFESPLWKKSTTWLDHVAAGGGFAQGEEGQWMRVGTPSPRRRKKKPLRLGFIPHEVLKLKMDVRVISDEIRVLGDAQCELETVDAEDGDMYVPDECLSEHETLQDQIDLLKQEKECLNARIKGGIERMRAEVCRMFPTPAGKTPKRELRKRSCFGG